MEQPIDPGRGRGAPKISEYFLILRKRKWILIFAVLFSLTVAAYQSYTTLPTYVATASLVLETSGQNTDFLEGFYTSFQPFRLETELQIISSRSICLGVVERLDLAFHPQLQLPDGVFFQDPFVEIGFPIGKYKVIESESGFSVMDDAYNVIGKGLYDQPFVSNDSLFGFTLHDPEPHPKRIISFRVTNPIQEAESIRQSITVQQAKDSNAFIISVSNTDPKLVAKLANAIAEVYVDENLRWKQERARKAREFIGQQIEVAEVKLRLTEDLLREYKEELGTVSFPDEARERIRRLSVVEENKNILERELAELEGQKRIVGNYLNRGELDQGTLTAISSWPAFQMDQMLVELVREAGSLTIERERLSQTSGPLNPRLDEIDRELDSIENDIESQLSYTISAGALGISIEGKKSQIEQTRSSIAQLTGELSTMPREEMELSIREQKSDVVAKIHSLLLERYEEARINESMETGDVRIVDRAIRPTAPMSPNHTSDLLLGLVVGLIIGIGLAMIVEMNDTTVKSADEIANLTGLTAIGTIPKATEEFEELGEGRLIVLENPRSPIAETYRIIRTNIQYFSIDKEIRVLSITSPSKGEGKTTTTANLGVSIAQQGHKTLLVDTDLRKAKMHRFFNIPNTPGFTELILGDRTDEDVIRSTRVENLFVLPSGHPPPNPSELLSSRRTKDILERFRQEYDRVILDTPPVLAVTDPAILGSLVDGTILVIESESSEAEAVKEAVNLLRNARAQILGFVLNKVDLTRTYKSHRYYHYYYHHDDEAERSKGSIWKRFRGKK
ncbi:MAG: polysaccharide biosynthesis tyrosine autokinase [bacterium]|nr:polysaccharide biosynthesis tyrosine autokinase [bacterium]